MLCRFVTQSYGKSPLGGQALHHHTVGLFPKGSTPQSGSGLHRFGTVPVSGKHRLTLERDGCFQPRARRGLWKRSCCLPKVPDCTQSFPSSKLPLGISADALCCARASAPRGCNHDRGCFGTHGEGWKLPGHWQERDGLARGSSPALWELGSLLTFTRGELAAPPKPRHHNV